LADFCLGPDGYYLRFWCRNVNERLLRKTSASSNGTGGIPLLRWFFFMGSAIGLADRLFQSRTQFGKSDLRPKYEVFKRSWCSGDFLLRAKALQGCYGPFLPHPRRDPARTRLSAAGKSLDLAGRLLGPRFLKPPLTPGAHGRD
jgi:hypothetical protein